jgi:hypothetical protein
VTDSDAPAKSGWVERLPSGPPEKDILARVVESDGGRDEAENGYYEAVSDPGYVQRETAQRRLRGQYLRRLRRLRERERHSD